MLSLLKSRLIEYDITLKKSYAQPFTLLKHPPQDEKGTTQM